MATFKELLSNQPPKQKPKQSLPNQENLNQTNYTSGRFIRYNKLRQFSLTIDTGVEKDGLSEFQEFISNRNIIHLSDDIHYSADLRTACCIESIEVNLSPESIKELPEYVRKFHKLGEFAEKLEETVIEEEQEPEQPTDLFTNNNEVKDEPNTT